MALRKPRDNSNEPRVNDRIESEKVRLVDADGEMVGVVPLEEALEKAKEAGLDLVEVSPGAEPPVCKILDYGKYKYEAQKKAREASKKQKTISIKEIKLRPTIDTHDLQVKLRAAHKFIDDGDKVKFTMRFRGREMSHIEIGMGLLNQVKEDLGEKIKMEMEPKVENRFMIMVVAPAK